jgi:uncharacterized membrane protein
MSYHERRALVNFIAMLLLAALYVALAAPRYPDADAYSPEVFQFWGTAVLIFIPVSVVAIILVQMVFIIISIITTGEGEEATMTDERDRLIELKSNRNGMWVFVGGFILGMAALALEMEPAVMFGLLLGGGLASALVTELSEFLYYRRGV